MKTIIRSSVMFLLLSGPMAAMADQGSWYSSGHMWGSGGWMWGSVFMWLLLIALVMLGIFAFLKSSQSSDGGRTNQTLESTPLDILKVRYAKGEINQEEYELRKKTLQS